MLDELDRKILYENRDGRMSNHALAERVGVSPSPTLRRLRRLEEIGAIRGYRAIVNPSAFGWTLEAIATKRSRGCNASRPSKPASQ